MSCNGSNAQTTEAYGHQELPFEKLVEELQPDRDTSHPPIFQVLFVLQENLSDDIEFAGLDVTPLDFELGSAKFDLSLFMVEFPEGLTASFEYNTDLFAPATIERMLDQLEVLLTAIAENAEAPIAALQHTRRDRARARAEIIQCDSSMAVEPLQVHATGRTHCQRTA